MSGNQEMGGAYGVRNCMQEAVWIIKHCTFTLLMVHAQNLI